MSATAQAYDRNSWPIERPYLATLKDLGLSDGQVASYFRVRPEEVARLRASYGIAEHPRPVRHREPSRRRYAPRRRG